MEKLEQERIAREERINKQEREKVALERKQLEQKLEIERMKDEMRYEEDLEMDKYKSFSYRLSRNREKILYEPRRLENEKMQLERKRAWL